MGGDDAVQPTNAPAAQGVWPGTPLRTNPQVCGKGYVDGTIGLKFFYASSSRRQSMDPDPSLEAITGAGPVWLGIDLESFHSTR